MRPNLYFTFNEPSCRLEHTIVIGQGERVYYVDYRRYFVVKPVSNNGQMIRADCVEGGVVISSEACEMTLIVQGILEANQVSLGEPHAAIVPESFSQDHPWVEWTRRVGGWKSVRITHRDSDDPFPCSTEVVLHSAGLSPEQIGRLSGLRFPAG